MTVPSLLSADDLHLFNEGRHLRLYQKLGAHRLSAEGSTGTLFAVWAPSARAVSVFGDFNSWSKTSHPLTPRGESGIWECFVPGVETGARYKFFIRSQNGRYAVDKTDPFAFTTQRPPETAAIVADLDYQWHDAEWLRSRRQRQAIDRPISIYEMHLGSWIGAGGRDNADCSYRELAPRLAEYVQDVGFTHVEFLPVMEHPFYGSWGYQTSGYFAPTSRYGTPTDFMYLIDYLHQHEIGVILDWVPSHFVTDEHGLGYFDGTHLYEHSDPRQGIHPDWNSFIFNYSRHEVRSFLLSNAFFWLDRYHADGLRVDAVASMLYLDYSRQPGQWIPNVHGGNENLEAISFLQTLNTEVYREFPDVITVAEESTAWPRVSRPTYLGGLGFGYKWDMGWMHDTLAYMSQDPVHRKYHHDKATFRGVYAFSENFVLPLSHDEVVHGKRSLLDKMPGDGWRKFANLRLLYGNMFAQPGKKLLFMGGEFAQGREWNHDAKLDWHLLDVLPHAQIRRWVEDLNRQYRSESALHELDCSPEGFEWVDCHDADRSILAFLRKARSPGDCVLVVSNFTPVPRLNYQVGVPSGGYWIEILNSDAAVYGGAGYGNFGGQEAAPLPHHGRAFSLNLTLPPLGVLFLRSDSSD